jgi:DNA-binding SARP family transcriptional activator/predicted ATPase/Flp pilus assembly protein TadD
MPKLHLTLLGSFHATLDGEPVPFSTDKARALLAYLALDARPHRREHLAGLLWSDQPDEKALHSLRQALSSLRKSLGDTDFLRLERDSVQFNPADAHLDVHSFQTHFSAALAHPAEKAPNIRRLKQAVACYQGHFLNEFYLSGAPLFEEWATLQREALLQNALTALSRLGEYHERRGEFPQAQQIAHRLLTLAPWDETTHRWLMTLYASDGQWPAAQNQFTTCCRYLREEIGVEPAPETLTLHERIRHAAAQNTPLPARVPPPAHNLPPASTPFVGRAAELDHLADALAAPETHLLTLLGPGGIGKTRLALESAREHLGLYRDGVFFVPLADLPTPAYLPGAIADAVGFKFFSSEAPTHQLVNYLQARQLLLILDNFEPLLAPEHHGQAEDLLTECQKAPALQLLVTSRQPLHLRAETILEIDGFPTPATLTPGPTPADADADVDALTFFDQSARRVQPRFTLAAEYADAARICQLLEGQPLALELAAAWVRVHPCPEIARQIQHDLDFLATTMRDVPARHRSVRAVFEHSWHLLTDEERTLLRALSVFRGGFTLQTATALFTDHESRITPHASLLASLTAKFLLHHLTPDRYKLHNLVQQFAAEKLAASPADSHALHTQHAQTFATFLAERAPALHGNTPQIPLAHITLELENLRAAWQWAIQNAQWSALEAMLAPLSRFYEMHSRFSEARDTFAQAVTALKPSAPPALLGQLLTHQGLFEIQLGQNAEARALFEEAVPLLNAPAETARALYGLSQVLFAHGDFAQAKTLSEEALPLLQPPAEPALRALLLNTLGDVHRILGDFEAARAAYETMRTLHTDLDDTWGLARAFNSLGILAGTQGDYPTAETHFRQSLGHFRAIGDRSGTARILHNLSILAYLKQDYPQTRTLRQECLAICKEIGFQWGITSTLKHLGDVEKAMGEFSAARQHYEQSLSSARQMGDPKSIVYALDSLGNLALRQHDLPLARACLSEAFQTALDIGLTPVAVDTLCGLAEILGEAGDPARAVEMAAFVIASPGVDEQTRARGEHVLGLFHPRLSPAEGESARQRGTVTRLEAFATLIHA